MLLGLTFVEAILAFLCFMANPPVSYFGLAFVLIAFVQWPAAAVIWFVSSSKKS